MASFVVIVIYGGGDLCKNQDTSHDVFFSHSLPPVYVYRCLFIYYIIFFATANRIPNR